METSETKFDYRQIKSDFGSYFIWSDIYDDKLKEEYGSEFDWENVLNNQSLKLVELVTLDEYSTKEKDLSGYAYPTFPFLEKTTRDLNAGEAYEALALQYFGLNEGELIPSSKLVEITSFRDGVLAQLKRQAEMCNELDKDIGEVLKVFWYETDREIINNLSGDAREETRQELIYSVQKIIKYISQGITAKVLFKEYNLIKNLSYTPDSIFVSTKNGLQTILAKKNTIIDRAGQFERKAFIAEDLIKWALTSKEMIDAKSYEKKEKDRLYKKEIYNKYWESMELLEDREEALRSVIKWIEQTGNTVQDAINIGVPLNDETKFFRNTYNNRPH